MMTFEQIYKTHNTNVKRVINKIVKNTLDAEDLAAETMIRVHKALPTYREEISKLSTWITNIATHAAIDHLRKKRLNTIALDEVHFNWESGEESSNDNFIALKCDSVNPEEKMIENEVRQVMDANFNQLNKTDQNIATLHYFDGLSYEEIAQQMQMPLGTIKAKIHKARVRLMEAFPVEMRKLSTIER